MVANCSFILGMDTNFNIDVLISQNPASDIVLTIGGQNFTTYLAMEDTTEVGYVKAIIIRIPSTDLPFNTNGYLYYSLVFKYNGTSEIILNGLVQKRII